VWHVLQIGFIQAKNTNIVLIVKKGHEEHSSQRQCQLPLLEVYPHHVHWPWQMFLELAVTAPGVL
jgi:hypothetical protein